MTAVDLETSDALVIRRIRDLVGEIESHFSADVIAYSGPMFGGTPDMFKQIIEDKRKTRRHALVWLETDGGFVESTERTANILRHHYRTVDFVVTTYAMSAGTILVMSGDSIYMDYSATLGPIDPQISKGDNGSFVPALGYLEQYDRLIEKSKNGSLTSAELAYFVQRFDPGELYQYEQARDLSIALLEAWLAKYKFKNWKETETGKRKVTPAMRRERAKEIALQLNNTAEWHSHSRGISMDVLRRKLNLQIEDLDQDPDLAARVSAFSSLFNDFRQKMGHRVFAIATKEAYYGHGH